jgi:outer membrane protein
MKNASTILSVIAVIGVVVLFGLHFSGDKNVTTNSKTPSAANDGRFKVAYVDIDTFEEHYDFLRSKREEFNKRQQSMQNELERSAQQYQKNVESYQRKAQSGGMTQAEGEATEKQLLQMQQSLRLREQALTEQLVKEKDAFNKKLHDELDTFLKEYNKNKGYDYILSYSEEASQILLADEKYNITDDVIKGMNDRAKKMSDTTKKK